MDEHGHHEKLIKGISQEYRDILKNSTQGIYVYLDDSHKVCNQNFAELLGYETPQEWSEVEASFTEKFVDHKSAELLVASYSRAMEKMEGSDIEVLWKKKNGESVKTKVILVPVVHQGHFFALHFVTSI